MKLTEKFILENCTRLGVSGKTIDPIIYFLIDNEQIVYVGQSLQGIYRVFEHMKFNKKKFDSYFILNCEEKDLHDLENLYIEEFKPKYNKVVNWNVCISLGKLGSKIKALGVPTPYYHKPTLRKIATKLDIPINKFGDTEYLERKYVDLIVEYCEQNYLKMGDKL